MTALTAEMRRRVLELAAMNHSELAHELCYGERCPECEKSRWIERLLAIIDAQEREVERLRGEEE